MSQRRQELLDLAERVLEDEGLEGFGIGPLARAAGIKPPSLYKHFTGLTDIQHALISRGLSRLGTALAATERTIPAFAAVYRERALAAPQMYRLMTDRPLDRTLLDPGAEQSGMVLLLEQFGETEDNHPLSRAAWAWAHGLAILEIADRFPPGTDPSESWALLVSMLSAQTGTSSRTSH